MTLLAVLVLMLAGFVLIALEIYTPAGILGVMGVAALIAANYLVYVQYDGRHAGLMATATVIGAIVAVVAGFVVLPKSSIGRSVTLDTQQGVGSGYIGSASQADLVGREGTAESTLRPSGVATIDGQRYDVVAEDNYVERGARLRVTNVDGNRIIVRQVDA